MDARSNRVLEYVALLMAIVTMALAIYSVPGMGRLVFLVPGLFGGLWAVIRLRRTGYLTLPLGGQRDQEKP